MVPRLSYLLLTLGAPIAVLALGRAGLRLDLALLAVVSVAGFPIGFVEAAFPFERQWNQPMGDSLVDVLHLVFSTIAVVALFELVPVPSLGLWPAAWPFVAQVALALVVAELGAYWAHRLMHTTGALWRVHVVHHSARRLHSLNSSRNHPLDTLALLIAAGLPLLVLGIPHEVLAATAAFALVHLQFQHANTRLGLGPFNFVLAGPELHRWHHSRVPEEANANYGHVLIVWDLVFRTRLAPQGRPPLDVGLYGGKNLPETYGAQLASVVRQP